MNDEIRTIIAVYLTINIFLIVGYVIEIIKWRLNDKYIHNSVIECIKDSRALNSIFLLINTIPLFIIIVGFIYGLIK